MRFTATPRLLARLATVATLVAAISCTSSTEPDSASTRDATDLRLLTVPYGQPALATTQVSFYAVKGRATGADIWYHAAPGQTDSLKFLSIRLDAASLDKRSDGSTIAAGDSVLVTVNVTDQTHFILDLQPSGLSFSTTAPPTITISFAACGPDLNYDGKVDATDQAIMNSLSLWGQEAPFQSWFKVASTVNPTAREVSAQLQRFTGYAIEF